MTMPPTGGMLDQYIESGGYLTRRMSGESVADFVLRHSTNPENNPEPTLSQPYVTEWVSGGITYKVTTPRDDGETYHNEVVTEAQALWPPD